MTNVSLFQGVLADYKANQALKEAERQAKIQEREAILTRMVQGARISNEDIQSSEFVQTNPTEEDDDDEDDDFLEEYRKKRLQGNKTLIIIREALNTS